MAINIITKEAGSVTHKIDGAFQASSTRDCILHGCSITYSGNKLHIGAGLLMLCGRIIEINTATEFTVSASGTYAALVFKIENEAISSRIVESATPTVTQEDINDSGNTYEAVMAVCTFADGSITGITKQIGSASRGGILYGTSDTPPAGAYADGTLYIKIGS